MIANKKKHALRHHIKCKQHRFAAAALSANVKYSASGSHWSPPGQRCFFLAGTTLADADSNAVDDACASTAASITATVLAAAAVAAVKDRAIASPRMIPIAMHAVIHEHRRDCGHPNACM